MFLVFVVVVFAAGAGSWYDYRGAGAHAPGQVLLILCALLVYARTASLDESVRVVGGLKLTATTFSLEAYIGVVLLAGIVAGNAILMTTLATILGRVPVTLVLVPSVYRLFEEGSRDRADGRRIRLRSGPEAWTL
jgi:hypothetical protein